MMILSSVTCLTNMILENSGLCIYMLPLVERYTTFGAKVLYKIYYITSRYKFKAFKQVFHIVRVLHLSLHSCGKDLLSPSNRRSN